MHYRNLINDTGFITVNDIFDRLKFLRPPDDETFYVWQGTPFTEVGVIHYGKPITIFKVWTGNQQVYDILLDKIQKAALILEQSVSIKNL